MDVQVNLSLDPASHMRDSRPAREEIEGIVKGLARFDRGITVRLSKTCIWSGVNGKFGRVRLRVYSVAYIKPIPTHEKTFCFCGEKWPKCHF